jgi:hypothetical protein
LAFAKLAQRHSLIVVPTNQLGAVNKATAGRSGTERKLLILASREGKLLVESADAPERVAPHTKVARGYTRRFEALTAKRLH